MKNTRISILLLTGHNQLLYKTTLPESQIAMICCCTRKFTIENLVSEFGLSAKRFNFGQKYLAPAA